ncbi:hypothetical protein [Demetria terragena]|uniref:hypothetical protein n=1 Tax=Demetria terragena TaxID=63959 RepID=UPI000477A19B|nr:hypothetical protein [Demetria terragena]
MSQRPRSGGVEWYVVSKQQIERSGPSNARLGIRSFNGRSRQRFWEQIAKGLLPNLTSIRQTGYMSLVQDLDITIAHAQTGEIIRRLTLDPTKDYQPQNQQDPNPH